MDDPEKRTRAKLRAARKKFDSIEKIEVRPLITKGSRGSRVINVPDLRSPDDLQQKWHDDPEEILAERRARARAARRESKDSE